MAIIWACVKDPGGMNGVLPVVDELEKDGHYVWLIANGKAAILLLGKRNFIVCDMAKVALQVMPPRPLPDLFITSMCSGGGVGRDLVPLLRKMNPECPIVALQDFWGAHLLDEPGKPPAWGDKHFQPDYVVVNDDVGKKTVLRAWPDFSPERVVIWGYPALDKYASIDIESVSGEVRRKLGVVDDSTKLVFVAGQGEGTAHLLEEVVNAVDNLVFPDIYLVPRPHPRTRDDFPNEIIPWQIILAGCETPYIVDFFNQVDTSSLVAASDIVISMFSTVLVEAAVLRKEVIAVLYPETGMRLFRESTGGLMDELPLVELGCAAKAASPDELDMHLETALDKGLKLRQNQEAAFPNDGKNSRRVANFLNSLIR